MRTVVRIVEDPSAKWGFRRESATYEDAEKITGFRLDRRSSFLILRDGRVEQIGVATIGCSGCSCDCSSCSYGYNAHGASGCEECGYTGKRRVHFGFPPTPPSRKTA
ncbi:hypothetical protein NPS29_12440 [Pseudomonas putida]|uniref:hypothetical protein n=1 Tax=Pseudomonas putida TaxID=303 RepID=UPI0023641353|nr:hypothetical protein [Pseudomonas putida]MDD1966129.1 hypothetical protein [Pseudomonas putida]